MGYKFVYENKTREWRNDANHFDNIIATMYTLFAIAVGEGWVELMYRGIDAVGPGEAPRHNHNPVMSLYFVIFHVIGNFFCLNLIIGILINRFTENRREMLQQETLSDRQRQYLDVFATMMPELQKLKSHEGPSQPFLRVMYAVATHRFFERFIVGIIITNMVFLATQHYGQSDEWTQAQDIGNYVCSGIFVLEVIIKILGLTPQHYFSENWNRFDFVMSLSILGVLVSLIDGVDTTFIRALPTMRLFRLVHLTEGLQKLFNTVFQGTNIAYFLSVGLLCISCFFMFGVAGVSLYSDLAREEGLDNNLNFETVPSAMLTLFTISTTEGWLDVRDGLTNTDNCGGEGQGACGNEWATIYVLGFMVIGSFMMLNLFAAVVVEMFEAQEAQAARENEVNALIDFKLRYELMFGVRKSITCREFLSAVFPLQGDGLLPARLQRAPCLARRGDPIDTAPNHICLTAQPTRLQVMAYLIALQVPFHVPSDGAEPYVSFSELLHVLCAKVFSLQKEDMRHLRKLNRMPTAYPQSRSYKIGHWFAARVMMLGRDFRVPVPPLYLTEDGEEEEEDGHRQRRDSGFPFSIERRSPPSAAPAPCAASAPAPCC
eukprot:TRINITY_DN3873_c0_g1_i9.p1 TRINITY_DN3873_c0_g1~~TRINITY_DN3873_c0_g1_i9.p1  ORF type:complete len:602 (+),score=177.42 TRINITY_DN3873_c0_g1_i9:597-2402(+)